MKKTTLVILSILGVIAVFIVVYTFFDASKNPSTVVGSPTNAAANAVDALVNTTTIKNETQPEREPAATPEAAATALNGDFEDRVHAGAGSVRIVENDGKRQLVFSDTFMVDAGPDLHVYITGSENPQTSADVHQYGDADLGALQNTLGAQSYDIPDTIDFEIKSVVIYCVPFKVVFSAATF